MTRAAGAARCPRCDYCKQGPDGYLEIEGPAGLWLHARCAVDCGLFTAAELVDRARRYGFEHGRWKLPPEWLEADAGASRS